MPETKTAYVETHAPGYQPDMFRVAYDSVNQGAFAVLVFAGVLSVVISRTTGKFLKSDFSKAIVGTIRQINENQVHVEQLVAISNRQHTLTETIGETVISLQGIVESGAELDERRHAEILSALTTLQKSIREVPK